MGPPDRRPGVTAATRPSWASWPAWGYVAAVALTSIWGVLTGDGADGDLVWAIILVAYVVVGAAIVSRLPRNTVGWLLLIPGVAAIAPATAAALGDRPDQLAEPATEVTALLFLGLWASNFTWLFVFFPVILLLALFPTGRPLTSRWRWHTWTVLAMAAVLLVWGTFGARIGPLEGSWTVDNPVGFLPDLGEVGWFGPVWSVGLAVITGGGLVSVVLRYRRAAAVERQQLKLLSFAFGIFAVIYLGMFAVSEQASEHLLDIGFTVGLLVVPLAIASAIFRFHLFDIDIVVRRTVVYAIVAVLLVGVYLVSIVTFESVLRGVTGIDSSIGVAASTLLVAALFDPVRRRVRTTVARRFFRAHHDRYAVAAAFGTSIRDRTEVTAVTDQLVGVVRSSLHPALVGLWTPGDGPTQSARRQRT
jgi:hypothetical protein